MKKQSQRLLIMEIALSLGLLIIALSLSFGFFYNALKQHRENIAMHKMTETMLMMSEDLRNGQNVTIETSFDASGEVVVQGIYQLSSIPIEGGLELRLMHEETILLAWPIWTGGQP
ncbi:MAG TPA: hypothetical protein DIC19_06055 [Erysipelotrichaceae bacterium]|nr:hypothetical protein [Erysipelotrichaceae bacterium]